MNVALLNPCYWPEVRRGSERFVRELADQLIPRGHRVRLLTSHPGRPSRSVEDGMEVVRAWRPPSARLGRRSYEDYLTHVPFSYLALRRGHDDLAHPLFNTDAQAAIRWSRETGKPFVYSYMGLPRRSYLVGKRKRLETTYEACRAARAVVALSEAAAAGFRHELGVEARVISPPVDVETFTPGGERSTQPSIFCPSALDAPMKRVGLLLEAFARVRRQRPDATLLLSRTAANERALGEPPPGVALRDVDCREALRDAYREAWVCALPSRNEGFGLTVVEAMACGTPGTGARSGAVPETLDRPEVGRLFDGDDPGDVAGALLETLELAQDPTTAAACRARAEAFSSRRCADDYEALYREVLGG